jgi:hypothetical protein
MYVLHKVKKRIFTSNYLGTLKLSKQRKFRNFPFFSVQCTGCVVRWSAEISR